MKVTATRIATESEHPDWQMWPGADYLDKRLQGAWAGHVASKLS